MMGRRQMARLFYILGAMVLQFWSSAVLADQDSNTSTQVSGEYEVPLDEFQIYLQFNSMIALSNSDENIVLSTVQEYISSTLISTQPNFLRIVLYQFVRDYMPNEEKEEASGGDETTTTTAEDGSSIHFAKIAVGGSAYFSSRSSSSVSAEQMQIDIMAAFITDTMQDFVSQLQRAGMADVVSASLMSIQGNEMDMQDGKIVEMSVEDEESSGDDVGTEDRQMKDDMKMMSLLLGLLIPALVICLACCVYGWRSIGEVNWRPSKTMPEAPIWQSQTHLQVSASLSQRDGETAKKKEYNDAGYDMP